MPKVLGWVTEKIRQPRLPAGWCAMKKMRVMRLTQVRGAFHHKYRGLDASEKIALTDNRNELNLCDL